MESLKSNKSSEDLNSYEIQSNFDQNLGTISSRTSFSSYDFTPSETPPREFSPRLHRKTSNPKTPVLQLSEDSTTWKVIPKRAKRTSRKQQIQTSTAKIHAFLMKGNAPEFRFRIIVGLLLVAIIIVIISTRYFYNRERIVIAIKDRIFFVKSERKLDLLDSKGRDLLHIKFGLNIPEDIPPINCKSIEKNDKICLDWKYRAHLSIKYEHNSKSITCYRVKWKSYQKYSILKDCFHLSDSFWYGMGDLHELIWPLNHMSIQVSPFVTSHKTSKDSPFGSLIGRYWFSSKGIAITVPLNVPLFVSLNSSEDPNKLCFISKKQFPYYMLNKNDYFAHLEYKICSAPSLSDLQNHITRDSDKTDSIEYNSTVDNSNSEQHIFLERLIWATDSNVLPNFTHQSLQSYVDKIMNYGFEPGIVLLDSRWENIIGDFKMNETSFSNPSILINILHNKGFKILLTITPNIDLHSNTLSNAGLNHRLFRDDRLNVPLLTRCGNKLENICGLINLTNSNNSKWFRNRLVDELLKGLSVDGFLFVSGQSSLMPRHINVDHNINPDNYLNLLKEVAINTSQMIGTTSAIDSKRLNGFVKILERNSSWETLRTIIPTVLSLGLMGYPLVNSGRVGGEQYINEKGYSKELYTRWLQLVAFLPVIQFGEPPGDNDLEIIKVAKKLLKLRDDRILPAMKSCLTEYNSNGSPIIRPMWWTQMEDRDAFSINDQFSIGNDIIVAPVVEEGKTERDIYLPHGWWKDEILAQVIRGGKWMRKYQVPIDKVAYFIRTDSPSNLS